MGISLTFLPGQLRNNLLIEQIIQIRLQYRVKLPDAIFASTALQVGATLVTADQELTKVTSLTVVNW
jgi:tRNA(fMet)-specific endonuclease VapC